MNQIPFKVSIVSHNTDQVPEWVIGDIEREGITVVCGECRTQDDLARVAGDADIVWMFGGSEILSGEHREHFDVLPKCGAVIRSGSGTDNVAIEEATSRGMLVCNTPAATAEEVSDHAIGLYFALIRQIGIQNRLMRDGIWDLSRGHPYQRVSGQTVGVIGFGHIARRLVAKMQGFGGKILVYDPAIEGTVIEEQNAQPVSLEELLSTADWVTIHCPLLPQTHHLIGEHELKRMKPTAYLINTARGPIIDEQALITALREGWIAGAGLDVFEEEPTPADNPLFTFDNVVTTPHIAGYSDQTHRNFWTLSVEIVIDLANGRWPRSYVNPDVTPKWQLT